MGNWFSLANSYPHACGQYRVKDTLGGPEYIARFNGAGVAWTIISFPNGYTPQGVPSFYLVY
jgi:hypothetical protein